MFALKTREPKYSEKTLVYKEGDLESVQGDCTVVLADARVQNLSIQNFAVGDSTVTDSEVEETRVRDGGAGDVGVGHFDNSQSQEPGRGEDVAVVEVAEEDVDRFRHSKQSQDSWQSYEVSVVDDGGTAVGVDMSPSSSDGADVCSGAVLEGLSTTD